MAGDGIGPVSIYTPGNYEVQGPGSTSTSAPTTIVPFGKKQYFAIRGFGEVDLLCGEETVCYLDYDVAAVSLDSSMAYHSTLIIGPNISSDLILTKEIVSGNDSWIVIDLRAGHEEDSWARADEVQIKQVWKGEDGLIYVYCNKPSLTDSEMQLEFVVYDGEDGTEIDGGWEYVEEVETGRYKYSYTTNDTLPDSFGVGVR